MALRALTGLQNACSSKARTLASILWWRLYATPGLTCGPRLRSGFMTFKIALTSNFPATMTSTNRQQARTALKDTSPKIIMSPLSRQFSADGVTVDVAVYKIDRSIGWTLEVVDEDANSTLWNFEFSTDWAAWEAFEQAVAEEGLAKILLGDGEEASTIH